MSRLKRSYGKTELELAIKYFPTFFDSGGKIAGGKTVEELKRAYIFAVENSHMYNGTDLAAIHNEAMERQIAFDYLRKMLDFNERIYGGRTFLTGILARKYMVLKAEIANYKFNTSISQDATTIKAFFMFNSFDEAIYQIFANIDSYFEKCEDGRIEISNSFSLLAAKLEANLKDSYEKLTSAHFEYKQCLSLARLHLMGPMRRTMADVGRARAKWKRAKNDACHTILTFYKDLLEIHKTLPPEYIICCQFNPDYNAGYSYIKKSPYYYCYLTKEESTKEAKQNKLRKQNARRQNK